MTVPAPWIQWPEELNEQGPPEDPTVLLAGPARIAGIAFKVTALRMRENGRTPDYLEHLPEGVYDGTLEAMMGDIEDLTDRIDPGLVIINGASYLLWMVPSPDR